MRPAIEVRGVSKAYGSVQALSGIDLDVTQGEFFALLGPNGAGKTTLISLISGLARSILFCARDAAPAVGLLRLAAQR
jgi:ABC-2 type transport system ATP-binding protein